MAIYRKGQASMDADGYITGYGTEWKSALTLIRPGATIVFATNPVAYATISEIVNDTSLRATSTGGAVVPQSDYVILLHDSITVDGLAQDVAETLRYYQGRETNLQEVIDLIETFDWQKLQEIEDDVKANAANAAESANHAVNSATQAASSATDAQNSAATSSQQANSSANFAKQASDSAISASNSAIAAAGSVTASSDEADRAKYEADRAKEIVDSLDVTKLLMKDNNLSDLSNTTLARANLGVDRLENSSSDRTVIRTSKSGAYLQLESSGRWGVYDPSKSAWVPLAIAQGGTGALSVNDARNNFGLGSNQDVTFGSVRTHADVRASKVTDEGTRSAAIYTNIVGSDGVVRAQAEIWCDTNSGGASFVNRNPTGVRSLTIQKDGRLNLPGRVISDFGAEFKSNGETLTLRPAAASQATYVLIRDSDNSNVMLVGRHGAGYDTILNNYKHNTNLTFGSRSIDANKTINAAELNSRSGYVNSFASSNSDNCHFYFKNADGKNRGVIYSNNNQVINIRPDNVGTGAHGSGLVINGATGVCTALQFSSTSDERAKFWIKTVTGALDKVCSLKGVTYSIHTTTQNTVRNAGLIAQDVQKVLPEAVTVNDTGGTLDKDCFEVENPLSLDYNALSALYVEAFKEMRDLIEAQKAEIESLKSAVASLQSAVSQ